MRFLRAECKKFREEMKETASEVSVLAKSRWRVQAVLPGDGDNATSKPGVLCGGSSSSVTNTELKKLYDSISECSANTQHTYMESDSDSGNTDALRFIMDELKVLRKEMHDTKSTVKDGITQMKKHMELTMNDVLKKVATNFEIQLTSIIEKVNKQNDIIVMIKDDVKSQAKCVESNDNKVNSFEVQLEASKKREKIAKTRLIHMEANERKNNLMFFGLPEEDSTKTCEQSLHLHITEQLNIETPCRIFNTQRVGLKHSRGPRPIVTSFAHPTERISVYVKRFDLSKPFGISPDYPPEIRKARNMLVPEMKRMKNEGKRHVVLKYPSQLWCENEIVRSIDIAEVLLD